MSVETRGEPRQRFADVPVREYARGAIADGPPLGDLIGDIAGSAQAIVRGEVRLAIAQAREEVSSGVRRATLLGGAAVLATSGLVLIMVAAVLGLATVVATWIAALIVAGVAFVGALIVAASAKRPAAAEAEKLVAEAGRTPSRSAS